VNSVTAVRQAITADRPAVIACRHSVTADCPAVIACRHSVTANRPAVIACRHSVTADRPAVIACRHSVTADRPAVIACRHSVIADRPAVIACRRSVVADRPAVIACRRSVVASSCTVAPSGLLFSCSYTQAGGLGSEVVPFRSARGPRCCFQIVRNRGLAVSGLLDGQLPYSCQAARGAVIISMYFILGSSRFRRRHWRVHR